MAPKPPMTRPSPSQPAATPPSLPQPLHISGEVSDDAGFELDEEVALVVASVVPVEVIVSSDCIRGQMVGMVWREEGGEAERRKAAMAVWQRRIVGLRKGRREHKQCRCGARYRVGERFDGNAESVLRS